MTFYFVETILDGSHDPDQIGTEFDSADGAMKAALWALIDIIQDEADLRTELDVTILVKDLKGSPIYRATLLAEKRPSFDIMAEMPVQDKPFMPAYRQSA